MINEKIKELAEQSGAGWDDKYHWYVGNQVLERFAQLLVNKHAEEAATYKALFEEVAYYLLRSLEGDDINDEAYSLMKKHKLVDEDGFWIYEDN